MKNFKLLIIALVALITVSSCMKNDTNYDNSEAEKEIARIDSTIKAQKGTVKEYALKNFTNPQPLYDNDSTSFWYEIIETPTEDEAKAYDYVLQNGGFVVPTATIKYKGELLNGSIFDEPSSPVSLAIRAPNAYQASVIWAWVYAFYPKNVTYNGQTIKYGMVEKGLKKGHKVRIVAASPYCYDNTEKKDSSGKVTIPKNSPLVFTIEVTDIKNL